MSDYGYLDDLNVLCSICLVKRVGESDEEALDRLQRIMDSELCNLADHSVSYEIHKIVID